MFIKVVYTIVIAIVIFISASLFLPQKVHVERAVFIDRPASTVFILLNKLNNFAVWSPWAEKDPDIVYAYSGPASGVGARLTWSGDPRLVGAGWQEIIESTPSSMIRMNVSIDQQGHSSSFFRIDPKDTGTRLSWGFDTNLVQDQGFFGGILARYFGLFFDQWIGSDYEQGLARFKDFAESLPGADFSDLDVEIIEAEPLAIFYIVADNNQSPGGVAASLAAAYQEVTAFMAEHSIEMYSQPMAITRAWDAQDYEFHAAIPVATTDVELSGRVRAGTSPSGVAVKVVHQGSYDSMALSYEKLAAYMAIHGLKESRVSWEHYISDPGQTPADQIITHIYFLIESEQ